MAFETLNGAVDQGQALTRLEVDETAFSDEQLTDLAAVKMVVQDVIAGESYLATKSLPIDWTYADDLYRAYVKPKNWTGTDIPRANLGMPIVLEVIDNHLLPAIHMALFSDDQPFYLEPKGRTSTQAAEAMSKILKWALKKSHFKEEMRLVEKSILQYGFGVGRWGWKTEKESKKTFKYDESADPKDKTKTIRKVKSESNEYECSFPTFEWVGLRNIIIDPKCDRQDIRSAEWVILRYFINANQLDSLRGQQGYKNIPTRAELRAILVAKTEPTTNSLPAEQDTRNHQLQAENQSTATSVDPLLQPLEVLERWDGENVTTVVQRKICIRNEDHELERLPFLSAAWTDVLGAMYGFGISKLLAGEQKLQQGAINSYIDILTMQLNPAFQVQKGTGAPSGRQNVQLSPGMLINESGELKALPIPSVTGEALGAVQESEARATRRAAANGGNEMPTQAMRTAEGVQSFNSNITKRLEYFIEIFSDLVFIPALEAMCDMCKSNLQPDDINKILTEEDGKAFEGSLLDIYNGDYSFDVLVSTQLTKKKSAAAMLPALLQVASSQPFHDALAARGKAFDFAYVVGEAMELSGWSLDRLEVDLTPEEIQRSQMQNSGQAIAAQSKLALQQQKHQDDLENIEQTGMARTATKLITDAYKEGHIQEANNLLGGNGI